MFSQLRYVQQQLSRLTFGELRKVSSAADVPFGTVRRIASRATENPRVKNIDKLAAYFRTKEKRAA